MDESVVCQRTHIAMLDSSKPLTCYSYQKSKIFLYLSGPHRLLMVPTAIITPMVTRKYLRSYIWSMLFILNLLVIFMCDITVHVIIYLYEYISENAGFFFLFCTINIIIFFYRFWFRNLWKWRSCGESLRDSFPWNKQQNGMFSFQITLKNLRVCSDVGVKTGMHFTGGSAAEIRTLGFLLQLCRRSVSFNGANPRLFCAESKIRISMLILLTDISSTVRTKICAEFFSKMVNGIRALILIKSWCMNIPLLLTYDCTFAESMYMSNGISCNCRNMIADVLMFLPGSSLILYYSI